jgi:hypothetical protein
MHHAIMTHLHALDAGMLHAGMDAAYMHISRRSRISHKSRPTSDVQVDKGRRKKDNESDVHYLPQPQNKSSHGTALFYFILFIIYCFFIVLFNHVFGHFLTTGVQKHEQNVFHKSISGLIIKNVAFFPFFYFLFYSVVLLDFF